MLYLLLFRGFYDKMSTKALQDVITCLIQLKKHLVSRTLPTCGDIKSNLSRSKICPTSSTQH